MPSDAASALALLILRGCLATVFIAHGVNHVFGGSGIAGTSRWFEKIGMFPGRLHAWLASLTEMGAGLLLVFGLLTPFACAGITGVMLVALITNHRRNGFFVFRPGEGWEYVMTLTALSVGLATLGPGSWSLDAAFGIRLAGWAGFAVSAGAGSLCALALLAVFWRPAIDGAVRSPS